MHRRNGGRASLWRLQHERHRLQGRRPGLPAALHPIQERGGEAVRIRNVNPCAKNLYFKVEVFCVEWGNFGSGVIDCVELGNGAL